MHALKATVHFFVFLLICTTKWFIFRLMCIKCFNSREGLFLYFRNKHPEQTVLIYSDLPIVAQTNETILIINKYNSLS